ncbi:hypothetical protein GCM10010442_31700 [Kitasatospora kifunensis]
MRGLGAFRGLHANIIPYDKRRTMRRLWNLDIERYGGSPSLDPCDPPDCPVRTGLSRKILETYRFRQEIERPLGKHHRRGVWRNAPSACHPGTECQTPNGHRPAAPPRRTAGHVTEEPRHVRFRTRA